MQAMAGTARDDAMAAGWLRSSRLGALTPGAVIAVARKGKLVYLAAAVSTSVGLRRAVGWSRTLLATGGLALARQTALARSVALTMTAGDQPSQSRDQSVEELGTVVSDKGLKLSAGVYVLQVGKRKFARVNLS